MLLNIKYETHWISFGAIGQQLTLILNFTFYLNTDTTNLIYYTLLHVFRTISIISFSYVKKMFFMNFQLLSTFFYWNKIKIQSIHTICKINH